MRRNWIRFAVVLFILALFGTACGHGDKESAPEQETTAEAEKIEAKDPRLDLAIVIGFSPQTRDVTIKNKNSGYTRQVSCYDIPK